MKLKQKKDDGEIARKSALGKKETLQYSLLDKRYINIRKTVL